MADFFSQLNSRLQQEAATGKNFIWADYQAEEERKRKQQQLQQQQAQPQQSKGFQLSDLLPSVGGVGGSLGGAAAGAAAGSVVPGVGTAIGGLLGALIGGAGGSALGKVGENAVEGQQDLSKGVGQEALFGGLTSLPIGAGFKLARAGLKVGGDVGAKSAKELIQEAGAATLPRRASNLRQTAVNGGNVPQATGTVAGEPTKASFQGRARDLGNKLLQSQYGTIPQPVSRAVKAPDTLNTLANAGFTKPGEVERVSSLLGGSNSPVTRAVHDAVGKAGGVDTSRLRQVFDDALNEYGIEPARQKALQGTFEAQFKKLSGGAQGSLNPKANPTVTLEVMRNFEKRIANLSGQGKNYRLTSPERLDEASVLRLVRDELEDQLYVGAGANKNLANVLTPELRNRLAGIAPDNQKWQQYIDTQIMGAKDVGGLRSATKPFVRGSQLVEAADLNAGTYGGRVGNAANGGLLGSLTGAIGDSIVAPATNAAARGLRAIGGAGQATAQTAEQALKAAPRGQTPLGAAFRQGTGRMAAAPFLGNGGQQQSPAYDPIAAANQAGSQAGQQQPTVDDYAMENFGVTRDQIAQAQFKALQANDTKAAAQAQTLLDAIDDYAKQQQAANKAETPYGRPTSQQYSQASTGLRSIDELEGILKQSPDIANREAIPGQNAPFVGSIISNALGTSRYRALSGDILNSIARVNTGANMPESERTFYEQTYLPQPNDPPATIQTKLNNLRGFFAPFVSYQNSGSGSLEDALASVGYQQ